MVDRRYTYRIILFAFLFGSRISHAQSFTVSFPDTIVYGPAIDSSALSCWTNDDVINVSGAPLTLDVVRVQDDTACPGWTSAFCFQVCSQPSIDSIRAVMAPNEVVNMAIHFIITGIPDSGTILMKIKNVNNPTEVVYQRFYGISQSTFGMADNSPKQISVSVFPNPALRGQAISLSINTPRSNSSHFVLRLYNISGSKVGEWTGLQTGTNKLDQDFPAGIYTFQLQEDGAIVHSGKFILIE